jgi:hypothetical protein
MKERWIIFVALTALFSIFLAANSQQHGPSNAPSPAATASKITPGTLAQVEVTSDIDVKKAHVGDVFRTRLWDDVRGSNGQVVLPGKTIIVGHVVECQPRTKDNPESKLTLAMDKAVLKDGSEIPLRGTVERVQISSIALAAADANTRSYNPSANPGSTTNIAMPASVPPAKDSNQPPTPGPTNIRDTSIVTQPDPSGTVTVFTSANKGDLKLKKFATLDVRVMRAGE